MCAVTGGEKARRRIMAMLLIAGSLALMPTAGCSFHSNAAADRSSALSDAPFAPENWPPRDTEMLADMVRVTPASMKLAFPIAVVSDGKLVTANWTQQVRVVRSGVYGRGIVRQFTPIRKDSTGTISDLEYEQREFSGLQFISLPPDPGSARSAAAALAENNHARYQRLLLRRLGIRAGRDDNFYLMRQGTRMRIFEPVTGSPRGILIHLSSLAGFDYEKPVIDALTGAGWVVLQVDPSTARRQEPPVDVDAAKDVTEPARRLARLIDNRIAEIAYAAEGGLDFLLETKPDLDGLPVVLTGYSAGALVGPAVATLLHDRVDAVVLVGGGANLLGISRRSTLTNGGISIRWTGETAKAAATDRKPDEQPWQPDESVWKKLEEAYLKASKLDPYNTGPYLLDKPVLMLHGVFDEIVPADTGELLYQRLGRPERVIFTLGHRGLFWRLPTQASMIAEWLDKQTATNRSRTNLANRAHSQPD